MTTPAPPALLPCPLAVDGEHHAPYSVGYVEQSGELRSTVNYVACTCGMRGPQRHSGEQAIAAWNTRATPDAARRGAEMLDKSLNRGPGQSSTVGTEVPGGDGASPPTGPAQMRGGESPRSASEAPSVLRGAETGGEVGASQAYTHGVIDGYNEKKGYPGQGDPWADFLHHRARVLREWAAEGKSPEESARIMSMDPGQVRLILAGSAGPPVEDGRKP